MEPVWPCLRPPPVSRSRLVHQRTLRSSRRGNQARGPADTTIIHAEPGTIDGHCSGIAISLIRYRYAVAPTDRCGETPISALRTAAGMKLLAVVNRGYKRDFIDIAAMIRHGHDLPTLMQWAIADIPGLTSESILRSLAWLDDAEQQPHPDGIDDRAWQGTRLTINSAIRSYCHGDSP